MALRRHLSLFLAVSSAACVLASPSQQAPYSDNNRDKGDDSTPLPLVIWHGLGDTFSAPGLRSIGDLAEAINPGTFTYYIHIGADASSDRSATYYGNLTDQLETVCADLAAHPILSTAPAIDALGFSQGGQFLRGYIERCNTPPVRSLVTFGSQHNGISDFKSCSSSDWLCKSAMSLLRGSTWTPFVQSRLVPAQYYRDPASETEFEHYLEHSNFLADINNERREKNSTYKENIASLSNFVMYMFEEDTVAIPKESSWFEEVNGTVNLPLRARQMYSEDWLGLRELDRKGGLKFRTTPGDHMQLDDAILNQTFADYFGPLKRSYAEPAVMDEL